ncbi:MAG TPA: cytochrome c biogenesis CcdA family protein [Candidatus Nanoarchaeia archaeon]|nr:cytochrome c biogenesis CcdA family protein [Candidatus Nanoarchaeia archaeon]
MIELLGCSVVAFIAGILPFLAPCTLPVLPAYLAYSTHGHRRGITRNTIMFSLGLALVFTLLGLTAGTAGSFVFEYKNEITYTVGALIIVFGAMSLAGKSLTFFSMKKAPSRTPWGSFVFGNVFALAWSGCIGPVLGFMLVLAANSMTWFSGAILLFIYAMGLITPLLLVSAFLDSLPKDGRVWSLLRGRNIDLHIAGKTFSAHTTNLLSGSMFIGLGIFLILNNIFGLTYLFPPVMTEWIFSAQQALADAMGLTLG